MNLTAKHRTASLQRSLPIGTSASPCMLRSGDIERTYSNQIPDRILWVWLVPVGPTRLRVHMPVRLGRMLLRRK